MNHLRCQNYKNEQIEIKYQKRIRKNRILKVKNTLLDLKIDFRELKTRQIKIRGEIEEISLKLINISKYNMNKFE